MKRAVKREEKRQVSLLTVLEERRRMFSCVHIPVKVNG